MTERTWNSRRALRGSVRHSATPATRRAATASAVVAVTLRSRETIRSDLASREGDPLP